MKMLCFFNNRETYYEHNLLNILSPPLIAVTFHVAWKFNLSLSSKPVKERETERGTKKESDRERERERERETDR